MSEPLTQEGRDALLARIRELERSLYPPDEATPEPRGLERARLMERYYVLLGEYGDRLPRVVMGVCPHTGQPLKRSFDPFGLDGPWWHKDRLVKIEEPVASPTFKVLLGALTLHGRTPPETTDEVIPGPEVPYVVPRLLELPGMVAVVSRLELPHGDFAYPIGYFSPEEIPPHRLHQHWLRQDLWFKTENGGTSWLIANDPWDFDLSPYVAAGKLKWIRPGDTKCGLVGAESGEACPYDGLPGDRQPQVLVRGSRDLQDPPNGEPFNPFED